jgi:4-diphosphocytidyl-2-C-methyl-D-erythritol kinase
VSTAVCAFSRPARAKLNLRLEVGPRDGALHRVLSVLAELELADLVRFEPSPSFDVRCEGAALRRDDNLAWRAAQALALPLPGVSIVVEKQIPMQAGLGGGSSDAAAALLGLATISSRNGTPISPERIADAALRTGSDVPSFLVPGLRIVSGVGDVVTSYRCPAPPWGIVLLRPRLGSSTARAYALLDAAGVPHELEKPAMRAAEAMCAAFCAHEFDGFVTSLHNDFAEVMERELPAIAHARERLEKAGARGTILCGSGSCVAGFFWDDARACDAAERIRLDDGEWIQVTRFARG